MKTIFPRFFASTLRVVIPSEECAKNFRTLNDEHFILEKDMNDNDKIFEDITVLAFFLNQ